jgi:hypothetical protein
MPPRPAGLAREFHAALGLGIGGRPAPVPAARRQDLLDKEVTEVTEASRGGHLDELAHEPADVVYTVYGTALVCGIDLDAVIAEVHGPTCRSSARTAVRCSGRREGAEGRRLPAARHPAGPADSCAVGEAGGDLAGVTAAGAGVFDVGATRAAGHLSADRCAVPFLAAESAGRQRHPVAVLADDPAGGAPADGPVLPAAGASACSSCRTGARRRATSPRPAGPGRSRRSGEPRWPCGSRACRSAGRRPGS